MYQRLLCGQCRGLLSCFLCGFGTGFEAVAVVAGFQERAFVRHWFEDNGECSGVLAGRATLWSSLRRRRVSQ